MNPTTKLVPIKGYPNVFAHISTVTVHTPNCMVEECLCATRFKMMKEAQRTNDCNLLERAIHLQFAPCLYEREAKVQ